MITKRLTLLILLFQLTLGLGQADTIKITSWNDLNANGYYQISSVHPWDSTVTSYCGLFEQNKFRGVWIMHNRYDSIRYSFSKDGILVDRKEFYGGKLFIHDQIKFDTLNSPVLITKKFRLWRKKEPLNYENRPLSTEYFAILDSLCDYSKFDYLWSSRIGGDGVYILDTNHRIHSYKGYYYTCPRDLFKTKFERFVSQGNEHLIFRKEYSGDSKKNYTKNEAYYFDGNKEILIAIYNSEDKIELQVSHKMINEIVARFSELAERSEDHKKKYRYTVLASYMK